jgi:glucose-1-phosphate thymidylyltransferase
MKGIILAGGSGTRLYPLTKVISKQILPVYDKPMIYYPLSTLMLSGIKDILIISSQRDLRLFKSLLGNGKKFGVNLTYKIQHEPKGLAEAFLIGEKFIGNDSVALILGDNIFYGSNLRDILKDCVASKENTIFAYHVNNPENYGVVSFNKNYDAIEIEEKPEFPKSNFAIPGLYFYSNDVVQVAKEVKPSNRGELEISDVNRIFLKRNNLKVKILNRGTAWLDTGTFDGLHEASQFISIIEKRQGQKVGCLEEISFKEGFIDKEQLSKLARETIKSGYGEYLLKLL